MGSLNVHMLYRVIRSFIRGAFDWQFICESESELKVRSTVRGGQEPERQHREAQRMGWNHTGPDHTENQSDHQLQRARPPGHIPRLSPAWVRSCTSKRKEKVGN